MTFSFRRFLFSSLAFWLLITIIGIYFLIHLGKYINFGIDLVGGTYIRLDVQVEKAVEVELADRAQFVIDKLKKEKKEVPTLRIEADAAVLTFSLEASAREAESYLINQVAASSRLQQLAITRQGQVIRLALPAAIINHIKTEAVRSNIAVLEARLNQFGVSEIQVASHGERSIVVELPNVHNPQKAKELIGRTALLEFKLVEDVASSEEEMLEKYGGQIPEGFMVLPGRENEYERRTHYLVPSYTDITGRLLKDAQMGLGGRIGAEPVVKFTFKSEGGDKFYELTSKNIGRRIAIIVDNVVINAPRVNSAIGTDGEISGGFTAESAQDLAKLLKSGAFVAPVTFEEERTIGPSLGAASVRQGLLACVVGLALLFLFSIVIYRLAGLFAFIVLFYNLLLILFALSFLGATLTLPGIAGMILTIGMAIDASILIFERIREELAQGTPLKKAVNIGFSGALAVILDANITHLLVSIVLYKLGTGPIKGFAVTMIIGIISTLITGLLLLKSIFNFALDVVGIQKIRI